MEFNYARVCRLFWDGTALGDCCGARFGALQLENGLKQSENFEMNDPLRPE
jgi:hypothetical protein